MTIFLSKIKKLNSVLLTNTPATSGLLHCQQNQKRLNSN